MVYRSAEAATPYHIEVRPGDTKVPRGGDQSVHARLLGFVHPTTGKKVHFEVDPPADFEVILTALRAIP